MPTLVSVSILVFGTQPLQESAPRNSGCCKEHSVAVLSESLGVLGSPSLYPHKVDSHTRYRFPCRPCAHGGCDHLHSRESMSLEQSQFIWRNHPCSGSYNGLSFALWPYILAKSPLSAPVKPANRPRSISPRSIVFALLPSILGVACLSKSSFLACMARDSLACPTRC